jgi:hypothetical protein
MLGLGILWLKHPMDSDPGISSLIIVMGFFLAIILNIIINGWLLILRLIKKPVNEIPRALIYINGGFLIVQLFLLIK